MGGQFVQCRPNQHVVGIDPGHLAGAIVVLSTDDEGRPRLVASRSWHRLRRKSGDVWRVLSMMDGKAREVPHWIEVVRATMPAATSVIALEGLFVPNRPARGLLALAEAAGVVAGMAYGRGELIRPRYQQWVKQVSGLKPGQKRKVCSSWLHDCYYETGRAPRWGVKRRGMTSATEHEVDAVGLALFAAGGTVVDV